MTTLCIYHANCADGFGAARAVHRALGDDMEFVAAKYGDNPPAGTKWCDKDCSCDPEETPVCSLRGRDILIVDFSYPLATLRAMAAEARSVLVLDHHKTAQKDLLELPTIGVPYKTWLAYNGKDQAPYPAAIFDMDRSGAGITWDYLSGGQPRPRIIDLVEDRDLWRFKHDPDTRRFHAVAASYGYEATPANFARWDEWDQTSLPIGAVVLTGTWADLMNEGEAILRYERQLASEAGHDRRAEDWGHSGAFRTIHRTGRGGGSATGG